MKPLKSLWSRMSGMNRKGDSRHLRARLESCVDTVLLLRKEVGEDEMSPEVVAQFERLRETLPHVKDGSVNEQDICRIEQITNDVLEGMRNALSRRSLSAMYDGKVH